MTLFVWLNAVISGSIYPTWKIQSILDSYRRNLYAIYYHAATKKSGVSIISIKKAWEIFLLRASIKFYLSRLCKNNVLNNCSPLKGLK